MAAEIVSGLSGKNTCLMKSSPLPRMLLQAWRRVEPKWSRKVSSAERNNCDVTAAPQARVLLSKWRVAHEGPKPELLAFIFVNFPRCAILLTMSATRHEIITHHRTVSGCYR
jgi:hypothetical protein